MQLSLILCCIHSAWPQTGRHSDRPTSHPLAPKYVVVVVLEVREVVVRVMVVVDREVVEVVEVPVPEVEPCKVQHTLVAQNARAHGSMGRFLT